MTKQQDFSMWSVNFILFCLANFLYYGAFYLYIPVLPQYVEMLGYADMFALSGIIVLVITLAGHWCSSVITLSWKERKQAPDERRELKADCNAY